MSAGQPRIHTFLLLKQPGQPDRVVVWDTQQISLGRASENDIAIDDVEISRRHAQFVRTDESFVVQNLNTSNGTWVNGDPATNDPLRSGDVIRIAEIEIVFYQSEKNPGALGLRLDFASQLKEFEGPSIAASDGEATMLGLVDSLPGADDEFEIQPASDFAYDLHGIDGAPPKKPAARDLDAELEGFGLDDLEIPDGPPAAPAKRDTTSPDFFELDDVPPPRAAVSLRLEIEGLEGELRRKIEEFLGKGIELPPLKIRVAEDDLD